MTRPDRRFYEEAQDRPFLVARVCGYLRQGGECGMCGNETHDGETYSPCCRLLAEEVVAIVLEAVDRGPEEVRQDR